jgi:hypothetical protein
MAAAPSNEQKMPRIVAVATITHGIAMYWYSIVTAIIANGNPAYAA